MISLRFPLVLSLPLALMFLAGCKDRDEIKTYRVSKAPLEDTAPATPPHPPGGPAPVDPAMDPSAVPPPPAVPTLSSRPDPAWQPQPTSAMRQASYRVTGDKGGTGDISLVVLQGPAGGPLDNVNRWLGQLGKPPLTEAQLTALAERLTSPLGDVTFVELRAGAGGPQEDRILGAMASSGGKTFFFKMRGPGELLEAQKEAFKKWVVSVNPAAPSPAADAATPAAVAPAADATPEPAAKPVIHWKLPAGWSEGKVSSMRYATFTVTGANAETADVSVVVLPGESGGTLDNVNRWRNQAGLPPVDAAGLVPLLVPVKAGEIEVSTVDLGGPKQHILAGWTLVNGKTWFFKLSGPDAVVIAEKDNFIQFLQSIRF